MLIEQGLFPSSISHSRLSVKAFSNLKALIRFREGLIQPEHQTVRLSADVDVISLILTWLNAELHMGSLFISLIAPSRLYNAVMVMPTAFHTFSSPLGRGLGV